MTSEQFLKNFGIEPAHLPHFAVKLVGIEPDKSFYYYFAKGIFNEGKYDLYCFSIKDENTNKMLFEKFPSTDYALKRLPETDTMNYTKYILSACEIVMNNLLDDFHLFTVPVRIKATRKL